MSILHASSELELMLDFGLGLMLEMGLGLMLVLGLGLMLVVELHRANKIMANACARTASAWLGLGLGLQPH